MNTTNNNDAARDAGQFQAVFICDHGTYGDGEFATESEMLAHCARRNETHGYNPDSGKAVVPGFVDTDGKYRATTAQPKLPTMYDLCPEGDDISWPGADEWYAAAGDRGNTYRSFLDEGNNWSRTLPEILSQIASIRRDTDTGARAESPRTTHTPAPWSVSTNGGSGSHRFEIRYNGPDHRWHVADVFGQADNESPVTRQGNDSANAVRIVECVNAHDALIAERDQLKATLADLTARLAAFRSPSDPQQDGFAILGITYTKFAALAKGAGRGRTI